MGRTLHYGFKPKNGRFTPKELEKLYDVGRIYRERCEWTCESIDIDPYNIYPNWDYLKKDDYRDGWAILSKRYDELAKTGLHPNKIAKQLVKEKIAQFHDGHAHPEFGFSGFTKTGGNELNSLQVVLAVVAATRTVKNATATIHDEGKLIRCESLEIDNGKARPDREEIQQHIGYLLSTALFDEVYASHREDFIELAKELYAYVNPKVEGWQTIGGNWENIAKFLRPINAEDFDNYPEYNAGQIMAGFNGEYFGLTEEDPEAASYRMCAMVQKMIPDGLSMQVAPKL